jgi:Zn-dependent protease with chaperone function
MDLPIEARLFGAGAPATGEPAQLILRENQLEVKSARGVQRVPFATLRIREVVSAHSGLEFSWDSRGAICAVQVFEPGALRSLAAHPALQELPQMAQLRSGQRRGRLVRTLVLGLVAALVLLPVLLLLVFLWQADRIAGAIATRIPVTQEEQLGRQLFAGMRRTLKLQESGPALEQVRNLGTRLTQGSRFRYEFHVAENPAVNAFALPGGVIVVHTGLLDAAQRPEELAGVLAHEVQHVEQRHSLEAMVKQTGMRGLWAALTGDVGSTLAGQAALQLATLRFSRTAELEADASGFDTLVRFDIDPQGMVDFFATLEKTAGASPPAWLSTHPASAARSEALRARREALGAREFPPLRLPAAGG